jgi:hypothetical protein
MATPVIIPMTNRALIRTILPPILDRIIIPSVPRSPIRQEQRQSDQDGCAENHDGEGHPQPIESTKACLLQPGIYLWFENAFEPGARRLRPFRRAAGTGIHHAALSRAIPRFGSFQRADHTRRESETSTSRSRRRSTSTGYLPTRRSRCLLGPDRRPPKSSHPTYRRGRGSPRPRSSSRSSGYAAGAGSYYRPWCGT